MAKPDVSTEGGAAAKMVAVMRRVGYNRGIGLELATVKSAAPNLSIVLDSDAALELSGDDLIVAEHLTNHKRDIKLTLDTFQLTRLITSDLRDKATESKMPDQIITGDGTVEAEGTIEYVNELVVGDRVIVMASEDQQTYYIIDRGVIY